MLPPLPAQGLSQPSSAACNPSRVCRSAQPGCPGPAAGGSRSSSGVVLPEQDSSGIVQPLAASPQTSSPGAWSPGSALTCRVDVAREALSPLGKRWCEQSPCSPLSGHRMVPEGQGAGSGHGEDGLRNIWCPVHWHSDNFWGTKILSQTVVTPGPEKFGCPVNTRVRGEGCCHSCSAEGMPRLDQEGHLSPCHKKDPILVTVHNPPH